jgi:hypothetical protein
MNIRRFLVALLAPSLVVVFAPLAPVAEAQVTVTCTFCVTITSNGTSRVDCTEVPCKSGKSVRDRMLLHVPEGSACSIKTPRGTTVRGQTSGSTCQLNRSLRPEDLAVRR